MVVVLALPIFLLPLLLVVFMEAGKEVEEGGGKEVEGGAGGGVADAVRGGMGLGGGEGRRTPFTRGTAEGMEIRGEGNWG